MSTQVKVYAGGETLRKWNEIAEQYTSKTAAFAVMVEKMYSQLEGTEMEKLEITISAVTLDNQLGGERNNENFQTELYDQLQQEFPEVEISVSIGLGDEICTYNANDDQIEPGANVVQRVAECEQRALQIVKAQL